MSLIWINLDNFWYDFGDNFEEISIMVWSKCIRGLLKTSVTIAKEQINIIEQKFKITVIIVLKLILVGIMDLVNIIFKTHKTLVIVLDKI